MKKIGLYTTTAVILLTLLSLSLLLGIWVGSVIVKIIWGFSAF